MRPLLEPSLEHLHSPDGTLVPARIWSGAGPAGAMAPVLMLHGLQSHSGWFTGSARFIASLGTTVYAIDRRGSGMSREPRGHCTDFRQMIDDVLAAVEHARARHDAARVHILGHCFGAVPAAAFACTHPDKTRSLVLATPGIFTRSDLAWPQKLRVLGAKAIGREVRVPIPLIPSQFSELEEFVRFIREDPLRLQDATASMFLAVRQARRFVQNAVSRLTMPTLMMCAGRDEICDNPRNRRYFDSIPAACKMLLTYPEAKHVLEYGTQRERFFQDLAWWFARIEEAEP